MKCTLVAKVKKKSQVLLSKLKPHLNQVLLSLYSALLQERYRATVKKKKKKSRITWPQTVTTELLPTYYYLIGSSSLGSPLLSNVIDSKRLFLSKKQHWINEEIGHLSCSSSTCNFRIWYRRDNYYLRRNGVVPLSYEVCDKIAIRLSRGCLRGTEAMRREEKRRRFNEAVVSMLFPHPPSPPQPQREEEEEEEESEPANILRADFDVDHIPEESEQSGCSTSDDDGEGEGGRKKLTRAQRKRLRKKKLKEDASRRGNIIGPLLPSTSDASGAIETEPPSVRRNAAENKVETKLDDSGEKSGCASQKKLKHRRMAKKVAKERLESSTMENCNQNNA